MDLGVICNIMAKIALVTRSLDISIKTGLPSQFTIEDFNRTINEFLDKHDKVHDGFSEWSYCPSSNIINQKVIPYWTFENGDPELSYANYMDFADKINRNVIIIQSQQLLDFLTQQTGSFQPMGYFLIFNCIGSPFELFIKTLKGLTDCEASKVQSFSTIKIYLIIAGIGILFLSFVTVAYFSVSADRSINFL